MALVGKLVQDGADLVTLDDRAGWAAAAPEWEPTAALLNATEHPVRDFRAGDHHLPDGVMSLNRACQRLRATVVLAKPIPPLPEGAVG